MTTIRVSKETGDRLNRLAAAEGPTLAQEIEKLMDRDAARPRPTIGGFRSGNPLSADEIDDVLSANRG